MIEPESCEGSVSSWGHGYSKTINCFKQSGSCEQQSKCQTSQVKLPLGVWLASWTAHIFETAYNVSYAKDICIFNVAVPNVSAQESDADRT